MTPASDVAVMTPGVRMASWSFYLGILSFIAVVISPIARAMPAVVLPILLFGGFALGVIAVVLGIVGLGSVNRASALAGLLLGMLAIVAFLAYTFYIPITGIRL